VLDYAKHGLIGRSVRVYWTRCDQEKICLSHLELLWFRS